MKYIFRFFKPFRPRLDLKLAKSAYINNKKFPDI
jgi:hypothetical protein